MTKGYFQGIDVYGSVNSGIVELYDGEEMVLDIGCGSGALGAVLKSINPRVTVYGVDVSRAAALEARDVLYRFDLLDLDSQELPHYDQRFDLIILADILEHLKRPDLLMLQLHRLLTHNGSILVSIPNVAHIRIRIMLLRGEFEYSDKGILDRTHLRFFTKKTLLELVKLCEFNVVAERPNVYAPRILGHTPNLVSKLFILVTRNFPNLFALQFILKLKAK